MRILLQLSILAYGLALAAGTASGEFAWIRFDSPEIPPGEAEHPAHQGWSVVDGFDIDSTLAEGQPGAFRIVRSIDRATPALFKAITKGEQIAEVEIRVAAPPGGQNALMARVVLERVTLGLQTHEGAAGVGSRPREVLELGFDAIRYEYYFPDAEGDGWFAEFDYAKRAGHDGPFSGDGGGDPHPPPPSGDFRVLATRVADEPDMLSLSWPSVPGVEYQVLWSPDMVVEFEPILTVEADEETTEVKVLMNGPMGFYRVMRP